MAEQKFSRTAGPGTFEAVPEADRAEQNAAVYPDDSPYTDIDPRSIPDGVPVPEEVVPYPGSAHDVMHADPADIAEQSIPVPMDDDYDDVYSDEES